jgi:hypothetical protein
MITAVLNLAQDDPEAGARHGADPAAAGKFRAGKGTELL